MSYTIHSMAERPELAGPVEELNTRSWPRFLLHGDVRHWSSLYRELARYQILFLDPEDRILACGLLAPITWDGSKDDLPPTIEEILFRSLRLQELQLKPNAFCPLSVMVDATQQGQGLSSSLVKEMRALALREGADSLLAPVRPTWKSHYPLFPMERYMCWQRADGSPFDPWIRVHWRLGAQILKVEPATLTIVGRVREWEEWTEMAFPESGPHVVLGAQQPVWIDHAKDEGRYEDPNVWMRHLVGSPE